MPTVKPSRYVIIVDCVASSSKFPLEPLFLCIEHFSCPSFIYARAASPVLCSYELPAWFRELTLAQLNWHRHIVFQAMATILGFGRNAHNRSTMQIMRACARLKKEFLWVHCIEQLHVCMLRFCCQYRFIKSILIRDVGKYRCAFIVIYIYIDIHGFSWVDMHEPHGLT